MIPILLSISGFLSYQDRVDIDFTQFDLACISGPNGAGKSSLLDAMTWVLFGQARKRDDSIINARADKADVSLVFQYENNIYRVHRVRPRDKTTILEFSILQKKDDLDLSNREALLNRIREQSVWKPLTERTLRNTEKQIVNTLHMDYDTFINASFFLQGKADQFTQQPPGERKRILSNILGLEVWEEYRKHAVTLRKEVENNIANIDGRLEEIRAELNEEEKRKEELQNLKMELDDLSKQRKAQESIVNNIRKLTQQLKTQENLVNTLSDQLENVRSDIGQLEQPLTERKAELSTYEETITRASEIRAGYKKLKETREELKKWEETASKFREFDKQREKPNAEIEAEKARLEQELSNLESKKSEAANAESDLTSLQKELQDLEAQIANLEQSSEKLQDYEEKLEGAMEQKANISAENKRLRDEMNELKGRIETLKQSKSPECPTCGRPLPPTERDTLISALEAQGKQLGDQFRDNQKRLTDLDNQINTLKKEKDLLDQNEDELNRLHTKKSSLSVKMEHAQQTIEKWEKEFHPRMTEIQKTLERGTYALEARKRLAEINAQLKNIGYDAAYHDKIRRQEQELSEFEEQIRKLENAETALTQLTREIDGLEKQLQEKQNQYKKLESNYNEESEKLQKAKEQTPDLEEAENLYRELQEKENQTRSRVGAAQQKVDVLDDLRKKQKEYETKREYLAKKVDQYKLLEAAFSKNGVPALLIEQALPQIQTKANDILERLSDGNMSIEFVTQAKYKDKKRKDQKETLDIRINDSAGSRDYEMYSGGEAFRINFAIRLALSEILAQRAGGRLQTLVIDEGFGSQDSQGRQRLIEAINLIRHDFAKILVITHIEELKDAFPNRIEVEKTEHGSQVRII